MKNNLILLLLFSVLIFSGCHKELLKEDQLLITVPKITGSVQKGPFLNGTSITIFELDSNFVATGRSFPAEIKDNSGSYELENIQLISNYVEIRAQGFYYNEVLDINSESQITLTAISDITNKTDLNVNLLTTIEKDLVMYYIDNGADFLQAKEKAQTDIIEAFYTPVNNFVEAELLDITKSGIANAKLLAISLILQGYNSTADLSQMVNEVRADILKYGYIETPRLGQDLKGNATRLNLSEIRSNLEAKLIELGLTNAVVPPFERYVRRFIRESPYTPSSGIKYPTNGLYGENLLHPGITNITTGTRMSMAAKLDRGTSLILKLKIRSSNLVHSFSNPVYGWQRKIVDRDKGTYEYSTLITGNSDIDALIYGATFPDSPVYNKWEFEGYENGSKTPSWSKVVTLNYDNEVFYPQYGKHRDNVLYPNPSHTSALRRSLKAENFDGNSVKVIISGNGWALYQPLISYGWTISPLNPLDRSMIFSKTDVGAADLRLLIYDIKDTMSTLPRYPRVTVFENGSSTPTRSFNILR